MPWDRSACDGRPATAHPDHPRTGRLCGHVLDDARAYDVGLSDDAGGGNPLGLASKLRAAPTQAEASRVDEYIEYTLYGVKESAAHPRKSLQIREGEAGDVDGIRMTMYYYDTDLNNHTSGHFNYSYAEADKCHSPFGGPTWCMTENMVSPRSAPLVLALSMRRAPSLTNPPPRIVVECATDAPSCRRRTPRIAGSTTRTRSRPTGRCTTPRGTRRSARGSTGAGARRPRAHRHFGGARLWWGADIDLCARPPGTSTARRRRR